MLEQFARWKANFFLHPEKKPQKKQYFGFKSNTPSPQINELKEFENELVSLISNIKFGNKPNHFQQQLKEDEKIIKKEDRAFIKADKWNNFWESYLAEQFCQITHYLAEQFRQITLYLVEQFHQIAHYLAEHLIQKNDMLFNEKFLTFLNAGMQVHRYACK